MKIKRAEKELGKYFLFLLIFVLVFLSFKIVEPYLIILLSAFILSYLVLPIYNYFSRTMNTAIAANLCIIIVFLVMLVPVGFVVQQAAVQAQNSISSEDIINLTKEISNLPIVAKFNINLASLTEQAVLLIFSLLKSAVLYIPSILISLLVLWMAMFYLLMNWNYVKDQLKSFVPFENKEKVVEQIAKSTKGIVYGYFLVALIEFVIASIGLFIAGSNIYFFLAFIVAILSFIPGLGPAFVFLPFVIYQYFMGNQFGLIVAIITWLVIGIFVDNFLKNKILGRGAHIAPFIMFLGILGGTSLFGIFGFILGPLVLLYTIRLLEEVFERD